MKKFKHWLIKKLGGCLKTDKTIVLTKTMINTETVNAEVEVNGYRPFTNTVTNALRFTSHQSFCVGASSIFTIISVIPLHRLSRCC
jgi:hypothetical protein